MATQIQVSCIEFSPTPSTRIQAVSPRRSEYHSSTTDELHRIRGRSESDYNVEARFDATILSTERVREYRGEPCRSRSADVERRIGRGAAGGVSNLRQL